MHIGLICTNVSWGTEMTSHLETVGTRENEGGGETREFEEDAKFKVKCPLFFQWVR